MAMSLAQVQASLALWESAYDAVSKGSTFSMNGRTLTRVDADVCWNQITRLTRLENQLLHKQQTGRSSLGSLANFESEV